MCSMKFKYSLTCSDVNSNEQNSVVLEENVEEWTVEDEIVGDHHNRALPSESDGSRGRCLGALLGDLQ